MATTSAARVTGTGLRRAGRGREHDCGKTVTPMRYHFALFERLVAALIACVAVANASHAEAQRGVDPPRRITIDAKPITAFSATASDQRRFGKLEYLGGLELKSPYSEFGGFSAIRVAPDGAHFVSLTDKGRWLTGRIVYEGDRPTGIVEATMA